MSRLLQKNIAIQRNGLQFPAKQHEVHGVAEEVEMPGRSEAFAFITEFSPW